MVLKFRLLTIAGASVVGWVCWLAILFLVDPARANALTFTGFYLSLLVALTATLWLLGFSLRMWLTRQEFVFRNLTVSFRQAVISAALVALLLLLQANRLLAWWHALLLVLLAVGLELFFHTTRPGRRSP